MNNCIFQSKEFYAVLENTREFTPFLIGDYSSNYVQGYITHNRSTLKNYFTRRSIIYGNPIQNHTNKIGLNDILSELSKYLAPKAIYLEFRNLSDQSENREIYEEMGFIYEDHLNIIVDLTKTEEELWKGINSKRKNEIRRAIKEGTYFEIVDNIESLQECYVILREVYSRAKLPLYKCDFFENLFCYLKGDASFHIFTANFNGKIIGCMLALGYKGVLYDFYAGSRREYYKKYPNDLIPWEVFKWAKRNEYHTFDFGGAGKPNIPYKVRDYKRQFGGKLVNYGRFKLILNKPLYKIGEFGIKMLKKYG